MARPIRDTSYLSMDSAFMIHYDTDGVHSPDLTSSQPDGTPDWIVEVATALDSARSLLLSLGFDEALPDGDGIYDVYIKEFGGRTYGETQFESPSTGGGWIAYLEMDNDFADDENYYTHGLHAARVTAAHEYFHAVQLAYPWTGGDIYFYELSSTWFEEVAYPEVNDWVYWYDDFADNPERSMALTNGYSIAFFGHYLTHAHDDIDIMRQVWDRMRQTNATQAIEDRIAAHGGSLVSAWTDCVARLFFNGLAPGYYFHADQDSLSLPATGLPEELSASRSTVFHQLQPGRVGLEALNVDEATNVYFRIQAAPIDHAARLVRLGDTYHLDELSRVRWFTAGVSRDTELILVAGGEQDSVQVDARISDLQLAINSVYPNPLFLGNQPTLDVEYILAEALPPGEHRVIIYDLLGREVYRQKLAAPDGGQIVTLSLPSYRFNTWPSGVYFLRLTMGSTRANSRTFTIIK
ncbi:MAG: T9SS type A sorting domain-containing protein [Fidelibacterota bacterium]|nr:MAG: T9SS type A sorting domain-containing protein [Candidatus Neomarinimicrobiota bacterium]